MKSLNIFSILKWFAITLALAFLFQMTMQYFLSFDEEINNIESKLLIDKKLISQIGELKNTTMTKRTSVSSSENNPPYMLYDFLVVGKKATAIVVVRVDDLELPHSEKKISINSIYVK